MKSHKTGYPTSLLWEMGFHAAPRTASFNIATKTRVPILRRLTTKGGM